MPDQPPPAPEAARANLQMLARLLRDARHLGPEAQRELAELVEELSAALGPDTAPTAETEHLAASAAHLAETLHHQRDAGLLAAARDRLQDAALRAETEAPVATGIALRLIDALANLGI